MSTNDPWVWDFAEDARTKAFALIEDYRVTLDRMELNICPVSNAPLWTDPKFHTMLVARIHRLQGKKQDADKWEAVKELFREAGRVNG